MTLKKNGPFIDHYRAKNSHFDPATFSCAEETVQHLLAQATTEDRPGILLGKVQSGKTRAFISVLALAFDNNYDTAIVLTKNSIALVSQTMKRLSAEFSDFINNKDIRVIDIMNQPGSFTKWEVTQKKHVFVAKKQEDNLERLITLLTDDKKFPGGVMQRILIVDDEADSASVGYSKKADQIKANTIAGLVNQLRSALPKSSFLQVTATPYSLYLQPKDITVANSSAFRPIRPAFSVLVPIPNGYVGGDTYFGPASRSEDETVEKCIHHDVSLRELDRLKKHDGRAVKLTELLDSNTITSFRRAIVTFLVGGCIQQMNGVSAGKKAKTLQYSFLVHTEAAKPAHEWQGTLTTTLIDQLRTAAETNDPRLQAFVEEAWNDLSRSLTLAKHPVPSLADAVAAVRTALLDDHVKVTKVNSDEEVQALLDDSGQLELSAPLNIFVGGQVLDRGVTIANLIGFFYGRRPQRYQQDTVLQHSRMFGYRRDDLAVTRFYTAATIRQAMAKMEEFDSALRAAIEAEKNGKGSGAVQFIRQAADGSIVPCSPNKILVSNTQTLRPHTRLVPFGFQTGTRTGKHAIGKTIDSITAKLAKVMPFNAKAPQLVDLQFCIDVLDQIRTTMTFDDDDAPEFNWDAAKAALRYLSQCHPDVGQRGKVWLWTTRGRQSSRLASAESHATYVETPDSAKTEGKMAKQYAIDHPILFLLGQEGRAEDGWNNAEFYWPVIRAQQNTPGSVFAADDGIDP